MRTSPAGGGSLPSWVRTREGTDPDAVHLTVVDPGAVTADAVRRCCAGLADAGYRRAVTNAMGPADAAALLAAGFSVREHLDLLGRPLADLPARPGSARRPLRLEAVVALDRQAFGSRAFDRNALREAKRATPTARLRIRGSGREPIGYALTGLAGWRAYVQRLGVDPSARRRGVGRALLLDGLHWAHRRGARTALVNTQVDNHAARSLYLSVGFAALPDGLVVLERAL